jgi:hypothetical protein
MAIRTEQFETDPLSRAVPGQSFTDIPGKNPYEHPAMTSSPKEAFEIIKKIDDLGGSVSAIENGYNQNRMRQF